MKKSKITIYAFLFFFLGILLISCKKKDFIKTETPAVQELNDYKFLNQRLKEFAIAFSPALNNQAARNIIRNKARLKFDEEYEVLIKDLFDDHHISSLVSINENRRLHNDLYNRSGEFLFPQIYIPRFQYLEDYPEAKGNSAMSTEEDSTSEELVYVFYSGDAEVDSVEGDEIYPGYKIVEGQFQFFTWVDEDYANEHEVWVFSLNEMEPNLIDPCIIIPDACGGGGGGGGDDPDYDPTDATGRYEPFPELGHQKINFKIQ